MATTKTSPEGREIDEISGTETTGHEWDGIKELNTPMPSWWLWTFYACIAFSAVYVVLYPAWPMLNSATTGVLGWSSRGDLQAALDQQTQANASKFEAIAKMSVEEIAKDPELRPFALAGGNAAFKINCVQCHGSGAEGGDGYPNLNDDDWIWGGSLDAIQVTLQHGIRDASNEDTRVSDMPAFGRDGLLDAGQISDVAWYVRKLSGQDADAEAATRGEQLYADNCAACHGDSGAGNTDLGSPALNDALWLYGGSHEEIVAQVREPQQGMMPGWQARLGDSTIKKLTIYVHSLGGGE
jgi:cytochrome c oxidase cbb3-type subunit III